MRIFLALLFFSTSAKALQPNYRGYSARALGMGNAFTAVADSHDAIYYNVAGLNRIEGIYLTFLDMYIGVNDLTDLMDTLDESSGSEGDDFVELIREIYGQNVWAGLGAKAGITMKNFALHYYGQAELAAYMSNPAYPTLDLTYKQDQGFHFGFAYETAPGLSMGLGIRTIQRTGGSYAVTVDVLEDLDAQSIEDEILREGVGYGVDFGLLYSKKSGNFQTSFGFAWHNVGDVSFRADTDSVPPSEKSYMSIGVAAELDLELITIIPAIDYKFLDNNEIPLDKKLDLGLEVDFPLFTVRGGYHQGYLTYGASVDLALLQLDLVSYAEELGAYGGQLEDRRYMAQLRLELGLDANFNFFSMDKKARRKLKQRR